MAGARLSLAERRYIVGGAEVGVRGDGRGRLDRREFSVQTGVIAQANGSARVLWDATNILVGIKAEIAEPPRDTPAQGALLCSVDWCAVAAWSQRGRREDGRAARGSLTPCARVHACACARQCGHCVAGV